ncbi:MAG: hypothetical protein U1C46_05780 [Bacteroidales bacterium]|nr:hypothetical protein [Bacteroidales bacterium]
MSILTIALKVPLGTEPLIGAPALIFTRWLPIGKANGISVAEDGMNLLLWFDLQSTWWAFEPSEEELKKRLNVPTHYVRVEVIVHEVNSDLANYIQHRDFKKLPDESEKTLQSEYEQLGLKILQIVISRINRLISYARTFKGQYWVSEYKLDSRRMYSYFQSFEAKGRINGSDEFSFQPGVGVFIHVIMSSEDPIKENEWTEVGKFVKGVQRTPLVLELLAGAEQLAGNNYARSALTEAVAALEVAILAFGRSQDNNLKLTSLVGPRLDLNRLSKQIEHMGLSGTIRYLLPLLFPEDVLPLDVLAGCQDAITERQNVIHNQKRNVKNVSRFIQSIRKCCKILDDYSENESHINVQDDIQPDA